MIVLAWSAASDDTGVTGYRIARNGTHVATTANAVTWTNIVLKPATTYTYTVAAVDAAGNAGPVGGGRGDDQGRQDPAGQAAAIADRGRRFTPDKAHVGQRDR